MLLMNSSKEPEYLVGEAFRLKRLSEPSSHPPKILILNGSLRPNSFSRLLAQEAGRILTHFGAEVKYFDTKGLPLFDQTSHEQEKVQELRSLSEWSEGHVWVSSEMHGNITGVMKNQIAEYRKHTTDTRQDLGRHAGLGRLSVL